MFYRVVSVQLLFLNEVLVYSGLLTVPFGLEPEHNQILFVLNNYMLVCISHFCPQAQLPWGRHTTHQSYNLIHSVYFWLTHCNMSFLTFLPCETITDFV